MIERPKNLIEVEFNVTFNFLRFTVLEIDLNHINSKDRSQFTTSEIVLLVTKFLNECVLQASDTKQFKDEFCSYYAKSAYFEDKYYRLVFCVCSDKPTHIGVITIYRITEKK